MLTATVLPCPLPDGATCDDRRVVTPPSSLSLVASTATTTLLLVVALVLIGLAMIALAVWLVRSTRSDTVALGPLEVMGDRSWRRGDATRRARALDGARPDGSLPPAPMVPIDDPEGGEPETTEPATAVDRGEPAGAVEAADDGPHSSAPPRPASGASTSDDDAESDRWKPTAG